MSDQEKKVPAPTANGVPDKIKTMLNIPAVPSQTLKPVRPEDLADDDFAREKVLNLLEHGSYASAHLAELAVQSQDAEHFDALAKLLKSTIEGAKTLIELKQLRNQPSEQDGGNTTNNLFVGSTAELQEMLEQIRLAKENKQ